MLIIQSRLTILNRGLPPMEVVSRKHQSSQTWILCNTANHLLQHPNLLHHRERLMKLKIDCLIPTNNLHARRHIMIDDPVEVVVEAEAVELAYHEWTWRKGYNLVSFPVMREDIETVADLYQEYALFNAPQDIIYVAIDGCWFAYNGQEGQIAGDVRITPYLGVLIVMDWTAIVGMRGVEQIGDGEVELIRD